MTKILVRGNIAPDDAVVLSDSEFMESCYDTLHDRIDLLKTSTETSVLLDALSDVLELANSILQKENISAQSLFSHAADLRSESGSFLSKKAVLK